MSFGNHLKASEPLRPTMNPGCLMQIPNGSYHLGRHGESLFNGGVQLTTGVGGRGNTFKSTLAHFLNLICNSRYASATSTIYDTEPPSVSRRRIYDLTQHMPNLHGVDLVDEGRLFLTDSTLMYGDEWFDGIKAYGAERINKENLKKNTVTSPFVDNNGNYITCLAPVINEVDSLSMMPISAVEAIYDKNAIGASGMNVEALRASGAKSQMLMQMSTFPGQTGMHFIFTAHVGDDLALDPYAPPQKKLQFLKNKTKFKQVPEKFSFVMNNLWYVLNAAPLVNDSTKGPQYPADSSDNMKGDTDLQEMTVVNLRAKAGPSGMPFTLVVSQTEGILVSLSEFHYCKQFQYGFGGNLQNYFLELRPDVSLSRTTVRSKLQRGDHRIKRAMEITSEMCQMHNLWTADENKYLCTPAELYKDIKELGYDWDILLNTRGYWVFNEDAENELPFLSTMDLLRMRANIYRPYWYDALIAKQPAKENPKELGSLSALAKPK